MKERIVRPQKTDATSPTSQGPQQPDKAASPHLNDSEPRTRIIEISERRSESSTYRASRSPRTK